MSLFGNYNTPGRGVLKAPQEKKGIFKFFEVYGRHMWKLMELNLLYFVFCIPLTLTVILMLMTSNPIWLLLAIPSVLVGPATAAMTRFAEIILRKEMRFCYMISGILSRRISSRALSWVP